MKHIIHYDKQMMWSLVISVENIVNHVEESEDENGPVKLGNPNKFFHVQPIFLQVGNGYKTFKRSQLAFEPSEPRPKSLSECLVRIGQ